MEVKDSNNVKTEEFGDQVLKELKEMWVKEWVYEYVYVYVYVYNVLNIIMWIMVLVE